MRTLATLGAIAVVNDSFVEASSIHQHAKNQLPSFLGKGDSSLIQLSSDTSNNLDLTVERHHHHHD